MMSMHDNEAAAAAAASDRLQQRKNATTFQQKEQEPKEEIDPSVPLVSSTSVNDMEDVDDKFRKKKTLGFDQRVDRFVRKVTDNFWSMVFLAVCTWSLYMDQFVQVLLYSRGVHRGWIHGGVGFATGVMLCSVYIDVVRKYTLGRNPRYEDARTSTHCLLACLMGAGLSFILGLWPIWGWYAVMYVNMWFFGVIVPISILFPMTIQMILFGGSYGWFMHAYVTHTLQ